MDEQIENYQNYLLDSVVKKIDQAINTTSVKNIVKNDLKRHIDDDRSRSFQKFYFEILENEEKLLADNDFFRQFKHQYSLQGIDYQFLNNFEHKKEEMLNLTKQGNLSELYFSYFASAKIKNKNTFVIRNLGSFFAKFVHTFRPFDYCALDNPIKNYFGLKNESFFVALLTVSKAYKMWSAKESDLMNDIRQKFKKLDNQKVFDHDKISDLKILDLAFWTMADSAKRKKLAAD